MLFLFVTFLVLIMLGVIIIGMFEQGKTRPRRPPGELVALERELSPVSNRHLTPLDLGWQRSAAAPLAWTKTSALLLLALVIGPIGVMGVLAILGLANRMSLTPWPDNLLWGAAILLILGVLAALLINRIQDWQKVRALETRGQLAQGVMLDRWTMKGRGISYCVAYYFDLPGSSIPIVRGEINEWAYHTYQIGDLVRVRYLLDNPQVCRLE